jgi:hypothetical protein
MRLIIMNTALKRTFRLKIAATRAAHPFRIAMKCSEEILLILRTGCVR